MKQRIKMAPDEYGLDGDYVEVSIVRNRYPERPIRLDVMDDDPGESAMLDLTIIEATEVINALQAAINTIVWGKSPE